MDVAHKVCVRNYRATASQHSERKAAGLGCEAIDGESLIFIKGRVGLQFFVGSIREMVFEPEFCGFGVGGTEDPVVLLLGDLLAVLLGVVECVLDELAVLVAEAALFCYAGLDLSLVSGTLAFPFVMLDLVPHQLSGGSSRVIAVLLDHLLQDGVHLVVLADVLQLVVGKHERRGVSYYSALVVVCSDVQVLAGLEVVTRKSRIIVGLVSLEPIQSYSLRVVGIAGVDAMVFPSVDTMAVGRNYAAW